MAICNSCEYKKTHIALGKEVERCGKCGCLLNLKTACLSCNCPILKWTQVVTKEDDGIVKEILNGNT